MTTTTAPTWEVDEKGNLRYKQGENEIYHIEPEVLKDPDRLYHMIHFPDINEDEFFIALLKACKAADIEQITLRLK